MASWFDFSVDIFKNVLLVSYKHTQNVLKTLDPIKCWQSYAHVLESPAADAISSFLNMMIL